MFNSLTNYSNYVKLDQTTLTAVLLKRQGSSQGLPGDSKGHPVVPKNLFFAEARKKLFWALVTVGPREPYEGPEEPYKASKGLIRPLRAL